MTILLVSCVVLLAWSSSSSSAAAAAAAAAAAGIRFVPPFLASMMTAKTSREIFEKSGSNMQEIDPSSMEKYFFTKETVLRKRGSKASQQTSLIKSFLPAEQLPTMQYPSREDSSTDNWLNRLPKIHLRLDPVINFKFKQQLTLLGTSITLGVDYLTDIAHWRSYCQIEDAWLRGRFSLRGSELGWAKAWMLNLGLGEQSTAMIKLRLGLNTKTQRLYAKLRFRTDPMSPFDIGDGLSCAGKLPLPLNLLPSLSRGLPLRVEYRMRINTCRNPDGNLLSGQSAAAGSYKRKGDIYYGQRRQVFPSQVVSMTTGLGGIEVSLDELNFCLEWDENSPVWGIGLVRNDPARKKFSTVDFHRASSHANNHPNVARKPPVANPFLFKSASNLSQRADKTAAGSRSDSPFIHSTPPSSPRASHMDHARDNVGGFRREPTRSSTTSSSPRRGSP
jgi:hypothetical protein